MCATEKNLTLADLDAWLPKWEGEKPPQTIHARINYGHRHHTGTISTSRGPRIRDSRRAGSRQYSPIFERHLGEQLPRLEIQQDNGRYKPFCEVVDRSDHLKTYVVVSELGEREWQAEDEDHAREQHEDAFGGQPDERIVSIKVRER